MGCSRNRRALCLFWNVNKIMLHACSTNIFHYTGINQNLIVHSWLTGSTPKTQVVIKLRQKAKLVTDVGREPWSSGYRRRLMSWRSWVWIPTLYIGCTFFTYISCKNCNVLLKRRKNEKEAGVGHHNNLFWKCSWRCSSCWRREPWQHAGQPGGRLRRLCCCSATSGSRPHTTSA